MIDVERRFFYSLLLRLSTSHHIGDAHPKATKVEREKRFFLAVRVCVRVRVRELELVTVKRACVCCVTVR